MQAMQRYAEGMQCIASGAGSRGVCRGGMRQWGGRYVVPPKLPHTLTAPLTAPAEHAEPLAQAEDHDRMSDHRLPVNPSDHAWHDHIVARANPNAENERAWLICTDCEIVVDRMVLCGKPTKRGGVCRVALPAANGEKHCWRHS